MNLLIITGFAVFTALLLLLRSFICCGRPATPHRVYIMTFGGNDGDINDETNEWPSVIGDEIESVQIEMVSSLDFTASATARVQRETISRKETQGVFG